MGIKLLFFLLACAFVAVLCAVPPYSVVYDTCFIHPPISYSCSLCNNDEQERRTFRYGSSYDFFERVEQSLERGHVTDPVILLPPQRYVDSMGVMGVQMTEPAQFYYYTGHKAVWANSPEALLARWTFALRNTELALKMIENPRELDSLLQLYKPYYTK